MIMGIVKFIRGIKTNLPSVKDVDYFYTSTDTKQVWINGTEIMREPTKEGTDGQVLSTNGNGVRTWITVEGGETVNRYPTPTNNQTAPLYTTLTDLGLSPTVVFSSSVDGVSSMSVRRIPSLIISNESNYFAACEARSSSDDSASISILFAKKSPTDTSWEYSTLFSYSSSTKYKFMNPSLCVDREGVENKGRIYLFCMKFQITSSNGGKWTNLDGTEVDNVYKYSDDEGETWSSEMSIGTSWGSSWKYSTISYGGSIVTSDGTLICPCMGYNSNGKQHSGIVYKKKGSSEWIYSTPSPTDNENDCTVYENNGKVYLNTRNTISSRCVYEYDFDNDSFTLIDDSFVPNNACGGCVEEMTIDGVHMYGFGFVDPENNQRSNPTLWVSADGIIFAKAIRIYNGVVGSSAGYSTCASYNNYVGFTYEYDSKIYFVDLTSVKNILKNCASFLSMSEQYILPITKASRFSALAYLYGGSLSSQDGGDEDEYIDLMDTANYASENQAINVTTGKTETSRGNWSYVYIDVSSYQGRTMVISLTDASSTLGFGFTASSYSSSTKRFISYKAGTGKTYGVSYETVTVPSNAVTLYIDYLYTSEYSFAPVAKVLVEN